MTHEFKTAINYEPTGTFVFCINKNKWRGADDYSSDGLENSGSDAFSFKSGELWKHNIFSDIKNTFYGVPVVSAIGVVTSAGKIKTMQTVSVEGNIAPTGVYFMSTLPDVQNASIGESDFKEKQGVYYAYIKRAGTGVGRISGPRVRGPFVFALFEFNTQSVLQLRSLNLGFRLSAGHEFI